VILPTRSRDYWLSGFARLGTGAKYVMRMGITRDLRNTLKERMRYGSFPDAIVVNAQAVKDSIARYPWVKTERIHVIYNGVDAEESCEPVPELKCGNEFLIVAAGRIESDKGFDIVVEAMALALREEPTLRCGLFGRGDMVPVIERRIRERDLNDKVRYLGFTSNLAGVLKQADLAISSSYREGVSNFILESWVCGCPVIATMIPGSVEIMDHEQRGGLVPVGDPQALAAAILRAYRDPELRQRWIVAGQAAHLETFNWTTMADKLEQLLTSLVEPPNR
jgi:glycosyltransferase involved in cell wall biosynthesis